MIKLSNISKTFDGKNLTVHAVKDVSLTIQDGEIFGIVGYSGAGKSTLVRCINFLERPGEGSVTIKGFGSITAENGSLWYSREGEEGKVRATEKHLKALRKDIGMIFQHFNLLDRSTIFENVAYPLKHTGRSKQEIETRVKELLELVDLSDKINSYPSELSGGQKQRVAIARSLAVNPKILLCDEATSALDPEATESILKLLKSLNETLGLTIVMITHEMAVVKSICDKVAVMEDGSVVEEGAVYDVFASPKQEITKRFVSTSSGLGRIDKLLEENPAMVRPGKDGILVKLVYGRDAVGDALISEASRRCHVNISIVLANVELLKGSPLGGMIVLISGEAENVDNALAYFESAKVRVEVLEDGRLA